MESKSRVFSAPLAFFVICRSQAPRLTRESGRPHKSAPAAVLELPAGTARRFFASLPPFFLLSGVFCEYERERVCSRFAVRFSSRSLLPSELSRFPPTRLMALLSDSDGAGFHGKTSVSLDWQFFPRVWYF